MDSGTEPAIWFAIWLLLLLIDFVLTGFGAALQTVTESMLPERGGLERKEKVLLLKEEPVSFIRTCWFFHILASGIGCLLFARSFTAWPLWISVILSLILIYLFGKAVPSLLGKKYSSVWCMRLYGVMHVLINLAFPFTYTLSGITRIFAFALRVDPDAPEDEVTEDEIISMVNEGHEQGVLDEHEAEMIQNIFELDDKEAHDIMTHRTNISAISCLVNLTEAISFMVDATNSRFPVYDGDIDNIIGVLHLKDVMYYHNQKQYDDWLIRDIPNLLRPAVFIPETRSIHLLFRSMQAQKQQMVIVLDEYGQTAGLVTMEDILEEIVGNIQDEYDEDERFIFPQEDGTLRMAGLTPLSVVEKTLGIALDDEDYETLNGYLIYRLDRIPSEDDHSTVSEQGFDFHIMEVENNMIQWVTVQKSSKATEMKEPATDTAGEERE